MDRRKFHDALRRRDSGVFGSSLSRQQIKGIEGILNAFMSHGDASPKTLAYALATAYHGTDRRMVPVREGFASTDKGARRAVNRLVRQCGPNSMVAEYAKPEPPNNHVYYRRGHIQFIGKDMYERSSRDAGVDLVKDPEKMLDPVIAARVLIKGLITGRWNPEAKGISHYLQNDDLRNARHTIDVADKWSLVAGYYHAFLPAIREAGGIPYISTPLTRSEPPQRTTPKRNPENQLGEIAKPKGLLAALFERAAFSFAPLKRTVRDAFQTGSHESTKCDAQRG